MTVTSVKNRAKATVDDYPGYCARPACRKEFRRVTGVSGRPNQYCSTDCQQTVRTERKAVAAKVRRIEEMLRQARTDLDAFDAHDLDKPIRSVSHNQLGVAVSKAATALKYVPADTPGIAELAELVEAVALLVPSDPASEEVA